MVSCLELPFTETDLELPAVPCMGYVFEMVYLTDVLGDDFSVIKACKRYFLFFFF